MSFQTMMALRYLRAYKNRRYLFFLALVSFAGIFLSVFAFLVIHSVMNGFSSTFRQSIIGFNAHLTVTSTGDKSRDSQIIEWLQNRPEVMETIPVVESDLIVESPAGTVAGAKIRGLHPEFLNEKEGLTVTYFEEEPASANESGHPFVLVGEELFGRLHFYPGETEEVWLINPLGDVGPTGELEPKRRLYRVAGVFSSGFYDFDSRYLLLDYREAEKMASSADLGRRILVRLKGKKSAAPLRGALLKNFPDLSVVTWEEKNRRLFAALKLERGGMFLLLSIVILIASFNVLALMVLMALTRLREVALLAAMGADQKGIGGIFRRVGLFLGVGGTVSGFLAGLGAIFWLKTHPFLLPSAYYLEYLPVKLDPATVVVLLLLAPLLAMLASQWPAWIATRVKPVEILRST